MSQKPKYAPPTTPTRTITQATLNGLANLIKLLPTGTVFLFQFLNPVLTNNGHCDVVNKYLSGVLIAVSAFSCGFASFTDSYTDSQGNIHYGIVTNKGLWPSSPTQDLSSYRLQLGDFVHAFFALIVFAVVALLGPWTFSLLSKLLMALPPAIGAASSVIFYVS
ncbi:UNVERIFIED_CONTAM: protein DMP2 [Sesamum radiatum]|uniref:Protein DMP2 n=1 Tax=Sesamum radiatum TaxID=300843 RepID=A0AAW2UCH7_SESRA